MVSERGIQALREEKNSLLNSRSVSNSACSSSSAGVTMQDMDVDVVLEVSLCSRVVLQPRFLAV